MGKFGFGKKGDDDEDSKRSALFGSRSKNKSPSPAVNPYAQPASASDPYTQAKLRVSQGLPVREPSPGPRPGQVGAYGGMNPGDFGSDFKKRGENGFPAPSPDLPYGGGGYGNSQQGRCGIGGANRHGGQGYGADKYGASSGYGADRYETGAGAPQTNGAGSRYGPGGYGGLGDPLAADESREALFGGARERQQQRIQPPGSAPPPYGADYGQHDSTAPGGYGGAGRGSSSDAYGDRQLTAEEEEEEDVEATKQQIKFIKQEDVSSTRNALRIAAQAEETGQGTLARLGAQSERIHNAEKNLDLTASQNRTAEDKEKELKQLNRSMFAVHVSNPFTGASRRQARDDAIMDRHRMEREEREATRRAGYDTTQRMNKTFQELQKEGRAPKPGQSSLAERAKYQFEADEDDDEMENEIDANLTALSGAASRLNDLARATGQALEEDNKHLDRINAKGTKVDDQIAMNRARLDRFKT
ncbi:MAG: hypothetical protein LQ343_003164 [Gyalolechia ehrenbergii]|nr:MAG: hypothetical protein LQ343_003164 [Gyalolechia ehrenbergii]